MVKFLKAGDRLARAEADKQGFWEVLCCGSDPHDGANTAALISAASGAATFPTLGRPKCPCETQTERGSHLAGVLRLINELPLRLIEAEGSANTRQAPGGVWWSQSSCDVRCWWVSRVLVSLL